MIKFLKSGAWRSSAMDLRNRIKAWPVATHEALLQEAHLIHQIIVDGITAQAPGNERALKPLALLTLAGRRLAGFGGTKALLRRADLRNSISVTHSGKTAFVGVLRQGKRRGKGPKGRALVDLAVLHEMGTPPFVIKVTPRMRRFLAVLAKASSGLSGARSNSAKPYVIVRIPARPFMRPAARKFRRGSGERYARRLRAILNRRTGTP